jgi:hypothetical protein
MAMDQRLRAEAQVGRRNDFEVLSEWETFGGNRLMLKARRKSGYASIWLDYNGHPVKIGYALHAGGVVRSVGWETLWSEQTEAWKTQQRKHITAVIASWHSESTDRPHSHHSPQASSASSTWTASGSQSNPTLPANKPSSASSAPTGAWLRSPISCMTKVK